MLRIKQFIGLFIVTLFVVPVISLAQSETGASPEQGLEEMPPAPELYEGPTARPAFLDDLETPEDYDALTPEQKAEAEAYFMSVSDVIIIATTELYNAKINSQNNNQVEIIFDIANGKGAQPGVKYRVDLMKETADGQEIVDTKVFDEVLSIRENETINKSITYSAPKYLSGEYTIFMTLENNSGLTLALGPVEGTVTLTGDGSGYVELKESSCHLTIPGDTTEYLPAQGVDITSEESLNVTCEITHTFTEATTVFPVMAIFERSLTGKLIRGAETLTENEVTLKPNTPATITLPLSLATAPQSYDTTLSFVISGGQSVSQTIPLHYVIRGLSGTIQNVLLDKDFYKKGENAEISFTWTGSADGFPDSRYGEESEVEEPMAVVSVVDGKGVACSDEKRVPLEDIQTSISLPITSDCLNPVVSAFLYDGQTMLDEKTYDINSKEGAVTVEPPVTEEPKSQPSPLIIVTIIILILIIATVLYIIKKKQNGDDSNDSVNDDLGGTGKGVPTAMLFFIATAIVGAGLFVPNDREVEAMTYTLKCATAKDHKCAKIRRSSATTISLNKGGNSPKYTQGDTITASASVNMWQCANGGYYLAVYARTAGSSFKKLASSYYGSDAGSANFKAPNVSGSNHVTFWFHTAHENGSENEYYNYPYTVLPPPNTDPTFSFTPKSGNSHLAGESQKFTAKGNDGDGDDLKYKVEWNDGDQWLPASGRVAQGTSLEASKIWNSGGNYSYRARAVDTSNAVSGWVNGSIEICSQYQFWNSTNCENYVCQGTLPTLTAFHGSAGTNLTNGTTPISYTSTPTGAKCEYGCTTGSNRDLVNNKCIGVTLNPSDCQIPIGDSVCKANVSWATSNIISPQILLDGGSFSSSPNGTNVQTPDLDFGNHKVEIEDDGGMVQIVKEFEARCVGGAAWNILTTPPQCTVALQPLEPGVKIEANPSIVRKGDTAVIIVDVTSDADVTCELINAQNNAVPIKHIANTPTHKEITTKNLTSAQIVQLTCSFDAFPSLGEVVKQTRIEIIPVPEEI